MTHKYDIRRIVGAPALTASSPLWSRIWRGCRLAPRFSGFEVVFSVERPHPLLMPKKYVPKDDDTKARKLFYKIMRQLTSPKNRRRPYNSR